MRVVYCLSGMWQVVRSVVYMLCVPVPVPIPVPVLVAGWMCMCVCVCVMWGRAVALSWRSGLVGSGLVLVLPCLVLSSSKITTKVNRQSES